MKGVETYIAVAMLIAITVVVGGLFVSWTVSMTQSQTQTVGNKTKTAMDCTRSRISIDDVYIDTSAGRTRISVRNSGSLADSVISAVVVTSTGGVSTNATAFPVFLDTGDATSIELNTTGIITGCGNFSKAIVATQCASKEFDGTPKNC